MGILDSRSALVVGASSGLGYGTALRFAQEGASVVAAARRTDKLEDLVEDARARGFSGRIVPIACDVMKEEDLDAAVDRTVGEFGQIDILACIAQAGLDLQTYLADTTVERAIDSYRGGPLYTMQLMQKAFPHMKSQGYGRIITCSSGSAVSTTTGYTAYAMAKAAIMPLTRNAAQEWAQYGITTNCVFPVTKNDHFGQDPQSAAALEQIQRIIPTRYMGDPYEDASPIIAFIASEGARYLNGTMVAIGGGIENLA